MADSGAMRDRFLDDGPPVEILELPPDSANRSSATPYRPDPALLMARLRAEPPPPWHQPDCPVCAKRHNPNHDKDGKFAPAPGGGGAGDIGDDPYVGEVDEGDYGYGRDPKGKSYDELDVDEDGNPKFSQAYRDKYGNVQADFQLGDSPYHLVDTEKGIHFADDTNGTKHREVIQEMTPKQAGSLGNDVYAVNTGQPGRTNRDTGVRVEPHGRANQEGYTGATVTFTNGASVSLTPDETFDLQESLDLSSG